MVVVGVGEALGESKGVNGSLKAVKHGAKVANSLPPAADPTADGSTADKGARCQRLGGHSAKFRKYFGTRNRCPYRSLNSPHRPMKAAFP